MIFIDDIFIYACNLKASICNQVRQDPVICMYNLRNDLMLHEKYQTRKILLNLPKMKNNSCVFRMILRNPKKAHAPLSLTSYLPAGMYNIDGVIFNL